MSVTDGGQAAKQRIDENRLTICAQSQVMNIYVAGNMTKPGRIKAVITVGILTGTQSVIEAMQMIQITQQQGIAITP